MHPNATVRFHASHSDASYLLEANAHSQACRHFSMGWHADPTKPIKLNGAFFTLCAILCFVVASAAEAKLGVLFLNCKQATIFWLALKEMGHPQPPTPVHCNISTAVGIANNTIERQRLHSMENEVLLGCRWGGSGKIHHQIYPGKKNLADYQSKHHLGAHHTAVCPWYLHKPTSVHDLQRASKPSTLILGCVGTLLDGYLWTNPLPQVLTRQSVPASKIHLPLSFGLPIGIPTLSRIGIPTIARAQIQWWYISLNLTTSFCQ